MSKDVPVGYKLTEVGVIPEDWEIMSLCDLTTDIGDGIHSTPQYVKISKFYFINGNNLLNGEISITDNTMCVSKDEYLRIKKRLNNQTILLSINGTIGNLAFFNDEDIVLGKSAAYININPLTNKDYVFYSLMTTATSRYFESELTGTTIRNLSLATLRKTPIPFPKCEKEQRLIACVLSDTDALITSLDKLIAKKRDIKQAAMQQILTGKQRLKGLGDSSGKFKQTEIGLIPEDWDIKRVGDICDFIVPGRNKPRIFEGDIPWITTPDLEDGRSVSKSRLNLYISKDEAKNVGSKIVPTGSILMSCVGELGIVALTENEIVINQQLHAFIPSSIIDKFFLLNVIKIQKNYIEGLATKTAVPYLNKDNCNSIPILLPSLPEQRAIAKVLSDIDSEISALEQRRDKTKALKQAMMQELLTGKTRLKS